MNPIDGPSVIPVISGPVRSGILSDDAGLVPDEAAIRQFLAEVIGDDIHVAAIEPDGAIKGRYFGENVDDAVRLAVKKNRDGSNIYWTANRCGPDTAHKPSKCHIVSARSAHVDIDPPKDGSPFDKAAVIRAAEAFDIRPTTIIDSGNGLQLLYRLEDDDPDLDRVEAINRAIAQHFAGDSCHNIERLLRVPGTVNYPNEAKRKRGCVPVMSQLVSHHPERRNTLEELEISFPLAALSPAHARASIAVPDNIKLLKAADLSRGDTAMLTIMIEHPEKHFSNKDRSGWAYGIVCQMLDDSYEDEEILGVLLNPDNAGCAHIGDQGNSVRAATRAISRAKTRYLPAGGSIFAEAALPPSNRAVIRIIGGNLPEIVDQAEQALIDANLGYFQSGGRIVRLCMTPLAGDRNPPRFRIKEVGIAELVEAMTAAAIWLRTGKNGDVQVDCPMIVAETFNARAGKWRLPPIAGIIDLPTLRPDGSLLSRLGYDASTGLLLVSSKTKLPRIPAEPNRQDAQSALDFLLSPISDFPFVTEADRSVALSVLLTSVCRAALSSAPLHGFSAPTAGSGKSTIVDIASIIRTGRMAAPIAQGKTGEELEKRLVGMLLEGEGLIPIDNCEAVLGGDFLCQLLTQQTLKVRPLGASAMVEVSTCALVTATGNNLMMRGDMSRRGLLCQLDPGVERPELREFAFEPVEMVKIRRGEFVAAALTILLAYHAAGRPFQVAPLGSFADWSNWVRSALIWLGRADPCDTMEKVRKADPTLAQIKAVMAQWGTLLDSKSVKTSDLTQFADERVEPGSSQAPGKFMHPDLREALLAVAGDASRINGRRLGNWLAKHEGRVVDGKKFVSPGLKGGQLLWVLETVST